MNPTEDEVAEFIKGAFQCLVGYDKYKMMDFILDSKFRIRLVDDGQEGKGLHIWDAIDDSFAEVDTFEDARKWVRENYSDPAEGFHPDIESIEIFKKVGQVVLEQVEGKDTYRVKIEHIPALPVADGEGQKVNCDHCGGSGYDPHPNYSTSYPICPKCEGKKV